jgi:2-oxoglutarate dehydrogenase E2 component (dihydrolipoamide succinyltransferase)
VHKTGKAVIVREDNLTGGLGGETAAIIAQTAFEWHESPISHHGSRFTYHALLLAFCFEREWHMATEVIMPQLGESVVEGTVGRWLIAEGETIEEYQPLLEVETDKVNTEIPSPATGVLLKVLVPEGATVGAGTLLALISQPDEAVDEIPHTQDASAARKPKTRPATRAQSPGGNGQTQEKPSGRNVITPVVARLAAEHGIDLATTDVPGSGRGGRITKKDILAYIEGLREEELPPWERPGSGELFKPTEEAEPILPAVAEPARDETPRPAGASPPLGEVVPLTSMRQTIAEHMLRSVRTSPHATTVMEADMSRAAAYRNRYKATFQAREGLKLTFTPFFIQAVVEGLKAVPEANSSFARQGKGIVLHRQINIGIAVALDSGLIVPVIKDADTLSLSGLQRAVTDLHLHHHQPRRRREPVCHAHHQPTQRRHSGCGRHSKTPRGGHRRWRG